MLSVYILLCLHAYYLIYNMLLNCNTPLCLVSTFYYVFMLTCLLFLNAGD
jgi:hypothetical protein